jgi:hypothetical protein
MEQNEMTYLGDGVYAKFDGYQIVLHVNDKDNPSDVVYLEYNVFKSLVGYGNRIWEIQSQNIMKDK